MNQIRIATRASQLALAQANQVKAALSLLAPEIPVSLVEVTTTGDRDTSEFLYQSSSVGFFTTEVEKALLDGRADVAVHSLKDLPTAITKGLVVAAIPQREQVCDVIVAAKEISLIHDLPPNAAVGTSSLRRITQLKLLRPDLNCQPLRGNIETRLRKVQQGQVDAIVIAEAGLNRLGLSEHISLVLPPEEFIPAPGQGALAIQIRQEDVELGRLIAKLEDPLARLTAQTERQILGGLHGGCSIPLGVHCRIEGDTMHIHAILCNLAATQSIKKVCSCPVDNAAEAATALTEEILKEGGKKILEELRYFKKGRPGGFY